jgi:hypothetical protein
MKKSLFGLAALVIISAIGFSGCDMLFGAEGDEDNGIDTSAPQLYNGVVISRTENTVTLQFQSSKSGSYYYLVLPASDQAPNAAAVKAQNQTAVKGTGQAYNGETDITVSGLTANVQYTAYIVVSDSAGNDSNVLAISGVSLAGSMQTAVSLAEGAWTDGASISDSTDVDWYSFEAEVGKAYAVQWNDSRGDGTYSGGAYLYVSAYQPDGTILFDRAYSGYSTPKTISNYSGKVYLKVAPFSGVGAYAIRYYTQDHGVASAVSLEDGVWTDGASISVRGDVDWYSFEAEAGKTYEVQWNDYYGDGTYPQSNSASLYVSAYQSNGTTALFNKTYSGYSDPKTISGYSGKVYLKVEIYSYTGDYAIRYYREGTGGEEGGGEGEGGETDSTLYYATYTGGWTAGGNDAGSSGTDRTLTLSADSISGGADISNVTTGGGGTIPYIQWDYVYADGEKIGVVVYYSYPSVITQRSIYLGKSVVSSGAAKMALDTYGITTVDTSDMSDTYQYSGIKQDL